jgi:hypothetical protein
MMTEKALLFFLGISERTLQIIKTITVKGNSNQRFKLFIHCFISIDIKKRMPPPIANNRVECELVEFKTP